MPAGENTLPDGGLNFGSSHGALARRIGLHPILGARDDLSERRDVVDQAHLLRRGGLELVAFEQHLQRVGRRHQPRHALRAAGAGEQADLDLRQADARLVAVGDDAVVAGERQLEGAAHADAVDRRGERLAAAFELAEDQRQLARAVEEEAHRRLFAVRLGDARVFAPHALQHRQVGAAGEAFLARSDDRALDRGVAGDLVDQRIELFDRFRRQHVHRAAGHVPGDQRDAVGVEVEAEILRGHRGSPKKAYGSGSDHRGEPSLRV